MTDEKLRDSDDKPFVSKIALTGIDSRSPRSDDHLRRVLRPPRPAEGAALTRRERTERWPIG